MPASLPGNSSLARSPAVLTRSSALSGPGLDEVTSGNWSRRSEIPAGRSNGLPSPPLSWFSRSAGLSKATHALSRLSEHNDVMAITLRMENIDPSRSSDSTSRPSFGLRWQAKIAGRFFDETRAHSVTQGRACVNGFKLLQRTARYAGITAAAEVRASFPGVQRVSAKRRKPRG